MNKRIKKKQALKRFLNNYRDELSNHVEQSNNQMNEVAGKKRKQARQFQKSLKPSLVL